MYIDIGDKGEYNIFIERSLNDIEVIMAKKEGTLRKEQAENTRQRLLQSARLLFAENGYKGTSVRSVNRSAGLADGLLYHYFPGGKKELFQTIVIERFQKMRGEVGIARTYDSYEGVPIEKVFTEAFSRFVKTVDDNIDIIRIIVKENDVQEFISADNVLSVSRCNKAFIANFLERRAKEGEIREIDFEVAASSIVSALINYIILRVMNIDTSEIVKEEKVKRFVGYYTDLWKNKEQ